MYPSLHNIFSLCPIQLCAIQLRANMHLKRKKSQKNPSNISSMLTTPSLIPTGTVPAHILGIRK